jgi:hypothetical protein
MSKPTAKPDFEVNDMGTVVSITPMNKDAQKHLMGNVKTESWQWMGPSLCVDHRYAEPIIANVQEEGFTVSQG